MKNTNHLYGRSTLRLNRKGWAIPMLALLLLWLGAIACTDNVITPEVGNNLPDEGAVGTVGSAVRSSFSFSGVNYIDLVVDENSDPEIEVVDELFYELNQPLSQDVKVTVSIGTELTDDFLAEVDRINAQIEEYNDKASSYSHRTKIKEPVLFPVENVQLEASDLSVPAGKTTSGNIKFSLSNKGLSVDTVYLLPIVVEKVGADDSGNSEKHTLQYLVQVYPKKLERTDRWNPEQELMLDTDFLTVFYVNTETYQPLIADIFYYTKMSTATWLVEEACFFGNIVNLKPAVVSYDATTKRALFQPGSDLRYVLEHAAKYIRPLQNRGRQVCICIQGGSKGIGFCNMTDVQIADFTAQVKDIVERYSLDGINLFDENSAYGKEGMPSANTTSYPKLIKALREALPGKLLTLTDKGEPTEYFHNVEKCGGIEVGSYIDYAWHGYFSEKEVVQVIEPWAFDHPYSEYTRQPIAGLLSQRYGSINVPRYRMFNVDDDYIYMRDIVSPKRIIDWRTAKRKENNIIVFGFDLTANEQGEFEGQPHNDALMYLNSVADGGYIWVQYPWSGEGGIESDEYYYSIEKSDSRYHSGYRLYMKDW